LVGIEVAILQQANNPALMVAHFEQRLKATAAQADARPSRPATLAVPDLVDLAGPDKAAEILRQALLTPGVNLQIKSRPTARLARTLALELIDALPSPRWELIDSIDAVELYEAMEKRFATPAEEVPDEDAGNSPQGLLNLIQQDIGMGASGLDAGQERLNAKLDYLLGLVTRDRTTDALNEAKTILNNNTYSSSIQAFGSLDRAGNGPVLEGFLHQLRTDQPQLPFWDAYIAIAA
jgi:hypothetical protein